MLTCSNPNNSLKIYISFFLSVQTNRCIWLLVSNLYTMLHFHWPDFAIYHTTALTTCIQWYYCNRRQFQDGNKMSKMQHTCTSRKLKIFYTQTVFTALLQSTRIRDSRQCKCTLPAELSFICEWHSTTMMN